MSALTPISPSHSPGVEAIIRHLCEGACHTFGDTVEWCESRGDCVLTVYCPGCAAQFIVSEDELAILEAWTEAQGDAIGCGVRIMAG